MIWRILALRLDIIITVTRHAGLQIWPTIWKLELKELASFIMIVMIKDQPCGCLVDEKITPAQVLCLLLAYPVSFQKLITHVQLNQRQLHLVNRYLIRNARNVNGGKLWIPALRVTITHFLIMKVDVGHERLWLIYFSFFFFFLIVWCVFFMVKFFLVFFGVCLFFHLGFTFFFRQYLYSTWFYAISEAFSIFASLIFFIFYWWTSSH